MSDHKEGLIRDLTTVLGKRNAALEEIFLRAKSLADAQVIAAKALGRPGWESAEHSQSSANKE